MISFPLAHGPPAASSTADKPLAASRPPAHRDTPMPMYGAKKVLLGYRFSCPDPSLRLGEGGVGGLGEGGGYMNSVLSGKYAYRTSACVLLSLSAKASTVCLVGVTAATGMVHLGF